MLSIAGIPVGDGHPVRICAEIGTNAAGYLGIAMNLVRNAKEAGCDLCKIQTRTPELAVPEDEWNDLRDTPWGKMTKIEYRRKVEFSEEQVTELMDFAKGWGIPVFTSVWDIPSVTKAVRLNMPCLKIPSARLHDKELLEAVAWEGRPIILSTGMSTMEEVEEAVLTIEHGSKGSPDLIILHCVSAYPHRAVDSNLRVIQTYKNVFPYPVGFSSHKIGIETCLLAVVAGASLVERHISTSRELKGSDHKISSTKEDLIRLVSEIRRVEQIMGDGHKRICEGELPEIERLRGKGENVNCATKRKS